MNQNSDLGSKTAPSTTISKADPGLKDTTIVRDEEFLRSMYRTSIRSLQESLIGHEEYLVGRKNVERGYVQMIMDMSNILHEPLTELLAIEDNEKLGLILKHLRTLEASTKDRHWDYWDYNRNRRIFKESLDSDGILQHVSKRTKSKSTRTESKVSQDTQTNMNKESRDLGSSDTAHICSSIDDIAKA